MRSDKALFHIIFELYMVRSMYTFVVLSDSSICKNTANLQLLGRRRRRRRRGGGGGGGGGGTVHNQSRV